MTTNTPTQQEIDEILVQRYAEQRVAKVEKITTATLRPTEIITTVEFECDDISYDDGHVSAVRVSVTRFTEHFTITDPGDDRTPYYSASLYYHPRDQRRRPHWVHAPHEVAEALVGRALTA